MNNNAHIFGIVGRNIGYSLSPVIHNTLFAREKIAALYKIFCLRPQELGRFIDAIRLLNLSAFNVTTPFKVDILSYTAKLDPIARATGAVNLVINCRGKLHGYNTDYTGIAATIERKLRLDVKDRIITLVGSGGAARTVFCYLARQQAARITVYHHSEKRRVDFDSFLRKLSANVDYQEMMFEKRIADFDACDLCVNCTPLPLRRLLSRKKLALAAKLFELRYDEAETSTSNYQNGLYMLAVQAAASFKIMTGNEVSVNGIVRIIRKAQAT
ncbi:MAG: shikimate dehydrogenase [candidate division Zixibacteria bacterium]|nr:shikimate dehydrogenase [candidate division Zixibacteria bacterium]